MYRDAIGWSRQVRRVRHAVPLTGGWCRGELGILARYSRDEQGRGDAKQRLQQIVLLFLVAKALNNRSRA